jgi:cellulose synthase/poly-beta-1,6-N-acetylglucosamine synthase-like glycosyltransferase
MATKLPFDVAMCLPAYNEEANLKKLLPKLVREKDLTEIVVIASGCTDGTIEVARSFEPRVRVLIQPEREGKASAINLFLRETSTPIVIMESTDTLPGAGTIRHLLNRFLDPEVGAVGSRPVPSNIPNTVMGIAAHILWRAHHYLALEHPKLGEMIAWRRLDASVSELELEGTPEEFFEASSKALFQLANTTAVDEAFIEASIVAAGYKIVYEPLAVTYNRGPDNMTDLIKQRKRIYRGHLSLKASGYSVSTLSPWKGLAATFKAAPKSPKGILSWLILMYAEAYSRVTTNKKAPEAAVWDIAISTKKVHQDSH